MLVNLNLFTAVKALDSYRAQMDTKYGFNTGAQVEREENILSKDEYTHMRKLSVLRAEATKLSSEGELKTVLNILWK